MYSILTWWDPAFKADQVDAGFLLVEDCQDMELVRFMAEELDFDLCVYV